MRNITNYIADAISLADLWLLRFSLGKAYLAAGYYAEALDEFQKCKDRQGEVTAIFLDDLPTFRHVVPLDYWLGRAQAELGMGESARENINRFIELRPNGGALVDDANQRLL